MLKKKMLYYLPVILPVGIVFGIFLVIALSILYTTLTAPKPDYAGFSTEMQELIHSNQDISKIERITGTSFEVIVKDSWFRSSEVDKLRFCKGIHDYVYVIADKYKLIYRDTDNVYLDFFDSSGIRLAEQNMNEFKILH